MNINDHLLEQLINNRLLSKNDNHSRNYNNNDKYNNNKDKKEIKALILDLAKIYSEKIHTMKEEYFEKNEVEIKDEVVEILLDIKLNILRKFFKEDLIPEYKEPFKLCPDKYKTVFCFG